MHDVLRFLWSAGFDGAPQPLGVDDGGREVLSFIPGEVIATSPVRLSDARLVSAAQLVCRFHDATAGTALAGAAEIVAHGDLGPHNIVFDGARAVAIIDWDEGVGPGSRLPDLAHCIWCCADVCEDEIPVAEQARKLALMCDAYGWPDRAAIVDEITASFERARARHAAAGREKAVVIFGEMIAWMERYTTALTSAAKT